MGEDLAPTERLLTIDEVAELLRVSRWSVSRWAADGDIPSVRLPGGRRRRFRPDDIAAFIQSKQSGDAA